MMGKMLDLGAARAARLKKDKKPLLLTRLKAKSEVPKSLITMPAALTILSQTYLPSLLKEAQITRKVTLSTPAGSVDANLRFSVEGQEFDETNYLIMLYGALHSDIIYSKKELIRAFQRAITDSCDDFVRSYVLPGITTRETK